MKNIYKICFMVFVGIFVLGACGNKKYAGVELNTEQVKIINDYIKESKVFLSNIKDFKSEENYRNAVESLNKMKIIAFQSIKEDKTKKDIDERHVYIVDVLDDATNNHYVLLDAEKSTSLSEVGILILDITESFGLTESEDVSKIVKKVGEQTGFIKTMTDLGYFKK